MLTRSMKIQERIVSGTVLHKLPAEALDIIATYTDNQGLAYMRATSRELRDGSAFEFFRRYTFLEVRLTGLMADTFLEEDLEYLTVNTKSPDMAMAHAMTQSLILPMSMSDTDTMLHMSPQNRKILRKRVSRFDSWRLVPTSRTNDFELEQQSFFSPPTGSDDPLPRLQKLSLFHVRVETALLVSVLEAHKHSLKQVNFAFLTLAGGRQSGLSWLDVFKAILSTEISIAKLFIMCFPVGNGQTNSLSLPSEIHTTLENPGINKERISGGVIRTQQAKITLGTVLQAFGEPV